MGRTMETGGGGVTPVWRSVKDEGEAKEVDDSGLYKLVDPTLNDYCTPPIGVRAKLRISGVSEFFQLPGYNEKSVMENKLRLEWLILGISGNNIGWMKGKRFSQIFSLNAEGKIGPNTELGKLFQKLTGEPVPEFQENYPLDGYIETEITTTIGENKSGTQPKVNFQAIETAKTVLSPAVTTYFSGNGAAPPAVGAVTKTTSAQPKPAAADAGGNDPFETGDDDL